MSLEKALEIINKINAIPDYAATPMCDYIKDSLGSAANHIKEEIAAKKPPPRKPVWKCPNGCFKEEGQCAGVEPGFDVNAWGNALFDMKIDQYGAQVEIIFDNIEMHDIDWDEIPRCGNCSDPAINIDRWDNETSG